jgi:hypothetical protein
MIGTKSMTFVAKATLCILIILITAFAAQAAGPVRDPQALALLAQCGTAMGANLIGDTYATGTIAPSDPNSSPSPIVSQSKGTKMRNEITFADGPQTFVANGTNGWNARQGKRANSPYSAVAYYRPEYVPALACVIDPLRPNMNVNYVGLEKLGTGTAYHIQFNISPTDKDDSETVISDFHVFLDQQTLVVVKIRNFVFDPKALANRSVWETYYSDYRLVGGAIVPFHVENYLDGQKVNDVVFKDVQINVGIADDVFN